MNHLCSISSVSPHLRLARWAVVVFAASIGFMLSGCGKPRFAESTRAVEVEVFIVTKGSQNVKLGLVEVSATKMESVEESLTPISRERSERIRNSKKTLAESEEKLTRTQRNLEDLEKKMSRNSLAAYAAQEKYTDAEKNVSEAAKSYVTKVALQLTGDDARAVYEKIHRFEDALAIERLYPNTKWDDENEIIAEIATFRGILGREVWKGLPAQRDALLAELPQYESATRAMFASIREVEKIRNDEKELRALVALSRTSYALAGNPDSVLESLPAAQAVAKTNADGKCALTLPRGGNWVLTARARRSVTNDDEETYVWLIGIPQNATHTMLSNDNVLNPFEDPLERLR